MKKAAGILLLVLLVAAFALPGSADMNKYSTVFMDTFDTVISLIGYAENQETFDARAAETHAMYLHLHKLFDTYNSYADEGITSVCDVNRQAAIEPVKVDPILFGLLTFCKSNYELVNGQTNVAMGSVLSIWHEYREAGLKDPSRAQIPDMQKLQQAAQHTDLEQVQIDPQASTVYLPDQEMSLDVGAIAKGYATKRLAETLEEAGVTSALLSLGGNVETIGTKADGKPWRVGVQNPDTSAAQSYLKVVNLNDSCLVTSGTYQRYYEVDGVRYHHIINPDTLMPWNQYDSVSILCGDSALADALSTAVFNMDPEEGRAFIEAQDGVEALWVFPDGTEMESSGFGAYVSQ